MLYPSHSVHFLIRCRILFQQSRHNDFHSFPRNLLHFIQMREQLLRQHQIIEKYRLLLLQKRPEHSPVLVQHLIFYWSQFDCRDEIISHRHTVFLIFHIDFLRDHSYFHSQNRFKTYIFHIGTPKKFGVQNGVLGNIKHLIA